MVVFFAGCAALVTLTFRMFSEALWASPPWWLVDKPAPAPVPVPGDKIEEPPPNRFQFHYAGKEKFENVFVVYRLDRAQGKIDRLAYTMYAEDKKMEIPSYDMVSNVDMDTGSGDRYVIQTDGLRTRLAFERANARELEAGMRVPPLLRVDLYNEALQSGKSVKVP